MDNPFHPAKSVDLRQVVYEKIKFAIVGGAIAPGEKLSEVDLASKLAVSRTPVREAIRQLVKTGLVTLTPRKGAYVTHLTAEDAAQLYVLRENLERFAVTLATAGAPSQELEAFHNQFATMDVHTDRNVYLEADRQFHNFLYESTGNRFLKEVLCDLIDRINLYRPYSLLDHGAIDLLCRDHLNVIEAMMEGDDVAAAKAMGIHIRHNLALLEGALQPHPTGR